MRLGKVEWGHWIGYILVGLVLLIEVPRFFGAYQGVDPSWLTALGTGIVLPVGSGYIFHTWWKSKRNGRDWLFLPFGVLLVLEPLILVPWGIGRLYGEPLSVVLADWTLGAAWITIVMLSPFAMTAGVVMALAFQKESGKAERIQELPKCGQTMPEVSTTKTYTRRSFLEAHPDMLKMTGKEIAALAGVSERTGTNWKAAARGNGNHATR